MKNKRILVFFIPLSAKKNKNYRYKNYDLRLSLNIMLKNLIIMNKIKKRHLKTFCCKT